MNKRNNIKQQNLLSLSSNNDNDNKDTIDHLERSLKSLLLLNDNNDNTIDNNNDSIEDKVNRVLKLALEAINKQQWRHIDELNFIDAADNTFPDLNIYKTKLNIKNNDKEKVIDNDETLDLLLSQYGRIKLKMNELKHLDISRAKNLHAISKEIDDINIRKGKAYTLKQVLNVSVNKNNKQQFQSVLKNNTKDRKNISNTNNVISIEKQIESLKDAERKAIESRRNEHKFWTILDRKLSNCNLDNSKMLSTTTNINNNNNNNNMKELEDAIGSYIDMMGTLDESVQNFMIAGQLSYQDMQKIASKVNSELHSELIEKVMKQMNDDDYYDMKDDKDENCHKIEHNDYVNVDVDSIMYRFLQSKWKAPHRTVKPALETLRSKHKDMLLKIAKATQPYSPYEFVFSQK
jgi:hypothetical protein